MPTKSEVFFDIITRGQLYLEGVKNGEERKLAEFLLVLEGVIRNQVAKVGVENLGDLTKVKLNGLLRAVGDAAKEAGQKYVDRFIKFLKGLLNHESRHLARAVEETDPDLVGAILPKAPTGEEIWKSSSTDYMPAGGVDALTLLAAFISALTNKVSNEVTKAYANNAKVTELVKALFGTKEANTKDGLFWRLYREGNSVVSTVIQHTISKTRDRITGLFTDFYMWNSVMDSRTTDVCRRRNGRTFRRGEGPLPPAHYNCRSSTVPIFLRDRAPKDPDNLMDWLKDQSEDFLRDVFKSRIADALKKGTLRPEDLPGFGQYDPLDLDDYKSKSDTIRQPKTGTK